MQNFRPLTPKRCSLPHRPPLPIFKDSDAESLNSVGSTIRYNGKLIGSSVIVEEQEAMVDLYTMGYFGSGSLSSGYPSFCRKKNTTDMEGESPLESSSQQSDSTSSNVRETLNLTLEEAFFLSHTINVLDVYYEGEVLSHENMWTKFQQIVSNFIPKYVAYHYFRSKGWVVKPGIKFGGDYTLYKEGPPFYHSSFVVRIVYNLNEAQRHQGFSTFLALYRALEVVKKDLLICQIVAPTDFQASSLNDLKKFKISEYLFRRWAPSENRE